jgi:hypothetical protein
MFDREMQEALEADAKKLRDITGEDHQVFFCEPCENEDKGCKTTCCCGEDMETHSNPMDCGHTPVDMHWWYCEGNCEREYGRS